MHLVLKPETPEVCSLRRLWAFLRLCHATGLTVTHYVLRPLTPDRRGFKEAPFSSNSYIKMLQRHLTAIGLFNGETGHSIRRGGIQYTHQTEGRLAAAQKSKHKHSKTLDLYLNETRHFGRPGFDPSK